MGREREIQWKGREKQRREREMKRRDTFHTNYPADKNLLLLQIHPEKCSEDFPMESDGSRNMKTGAGKTKETVIEPEKIA